MNHHHHAEHSHDHGDIFHTHAPIHKMKKAFFLTLFILIIEIVGGIISHSLALLSDAGHVLTDIAAIGLSWFAMNQATKPPNERMTFGYYRAGILAAFINGITLIVITVFILWEAIQRIQDPQPVESTWMFISAGVGLLLNLYLGLGMKSEDDINVRSAVLHMFGDAAASAGVIIGGFIIQTTGWNVVDPILSILIALLIAYGAWKIIRQAFSVLMEAIPKNLDFQKIVDAIQQVNGVRDIHDLHVWSITSGKNALSCHVVMDSSITIGESQNIIRAIEHELAHLGIGHTTIQAEDNHHPHRKSVLCCEDNHKHQH